MINFIQWCESRRKDAPGQMSFWNDEGEPTMPTIGMLDVTQCAKYLQVAPRTVMKWIDSGRLPATPDRFVKPADLVKFMTDNSTTQPPAELLAMVEPEHIVAPKGKKSSMLKHYEELKSKHPGMVILFRKGDFYEMFQEDAERVAKLLKLPITRRQEGEVSLSMTGFPHKELETYLRKMLANKLRVAIADEIKHT